MKESLYQPFDPEELHRDRMDIESYNIKCDAIPRKERRAYERMFNKNKKKSNHG